ncbi:MAG: putative ABC exporter domain-containing protein [Defluviitaleaceae bacterium]|nr:putative ABC exporter domain-containing protein [Defluviitaleaceae bacterium]
MNSLTYLLIRSTINKIKEVLKSPGKLIAYGLGIAFILFFVGISVFTGGAAYEDAAPPNLLTLKAILFGFFTLTFFTTSLAGLKGTSDYGMEDVNFLFVSPIRARTILLYGIIKSFRTIIIGSWFVLFQAGWLQSGFGVNMGGVFLLWLGYVVLALACQMLSIFMYAMTNGNRRRIFIAKLCIAAAFVPVAVLAVYHFFAGAGFDAVFGSPVFDFTPIVGWGAAAAVALITGEGLVAAFFFGLLLVFGAVLVAIIYVKDPDFYEHVAGATQTIFETRQAVQQGDVQAALGKSDKKVRVRGTGLNRGFGASVFFYKHLRESFRTRLFGIWGVPSFLYIAGAGFFGFISLRNGETGDAVVLTILSIMLSITLFTSSTWRGQMELTGHYIYMIPQSPLKKWLFAHMEVLLKFSVEGVLIFAAPWFVLGGSPVNFIAAALIYITFAFYMLGTDLAFMRLTGIASRSVLLSILMLFMYVLPLIPGLVAAIVVGVIVGGAFGLTIGLIIFALWQVFVGLICFIVSKGMLHDCDILSLDALTKNL